jgi:hypothetical protein
MRQPKHSLEPLIEAGDFKMVAVNLIADQADPRRGYNVWRWWKREYGDRPDFPELTAALTLAFLRQFSVGGELIRSIIAKIFGRGHAAAKLPFKKFLNLLKKRNASNWILPRNLSVQAFTTAVPPPKPVRISPRYRYPKFPVLRKGQVYIDLRRDAHELMMLLAMCVKRYAAKAAGGRLPPVSAVEAGYYLRQQCWVVIHFDKRTRHSNDGIWTEYIARESVKIPAWKSGHDAAQKRGGVFITPAGKTVRLPADVSCARLAAIYGGMIKTVLLDARKAGVFKTLPKREGCQLEVEEFDGMWAWPRLNHLGKANLA